MGPDIARLASLMGDPARSNILEALMDGRALTASELAAAAGVGASTASAHLSKLEEAGLVTNLKQGRHRYYSLANEQVGHLLENLMSLADHLGPCPGAHWSARASAAPSPRVLQPSGR